jgi:DNA-binding NarL/FixJ family response regulator
MTIIIADDSQMLRERIKSLFITFTNISIVGEAENGIQALDLIIEKEPDLAILDIRMPEMNGVEVLKKAKSLGLKTKICILTNYPYKQYREKCLAEGAYCFFDKNQDIRQITDVISDLANKYDAIKQ